LKSLPHISSAFSIGVYMKKLLLIVFMFMQFSVFASGSKESWASYGGGYGHIVET